MRKNMEKPTKMHDLGVFQEPSIFIVGFMHPPRHRERGTTLPLPQWLPSLRHSHLRRCTSSLSHSLRTWRPAPLASRRGSCQFNWVIASENKEAHDHVHWSSLELLYKFCNVITCYYYYQYLSIIKWLMIWYPKRKLTTRNSTTGDEPLQHTACTEMDRWDALCKTPRCQFWDP